MAEFTRRFRDALDWAAALHVKQVRKASGVPYVGHLLQVAGTVIDHGADEDEAIAALLHDAVEDQGGLRTLEEIRRRFGERVASMVETCSDTHEHPKPPWGERKARYLDRLEEATPSVLLVSAADKLHNARSLTRELRGRGAATWEDFTGDRDGSLEYYRAVLARVRDGVPDALAHELAVAVDDLEQAARDAR